jgi:hypothetical protein
VPMSPAVGRTIQDEGTSQSGRSKLNFVGSGVSTIDDVANDATKVIIDPFLSGAVYGPLDNNEFGKPRLLTAGGNWNFTSVSSFYWAPAGTANAPDAINAYIVLQLAPPDGPAGSSDHLVQIAFGVTDPSKEYQRVFSIPAGTWGAWAPLSGGGGSGGHTIQDEGVSLAARTKLNFVGAGVAAVDDSANDRTVVTINPGGAVTMDPWHTVGSAGEPAFVNGYANYDTATYPACAYRKDPLGKVQLRGLLLTGTTNGTAFVLPVGYRPSKQMLFISQASSPGQCRVDIYTSGAVFVSGMVASSWVSLDMIEFDTDTVTAMPTGPQGPKGDTGATGGNATVPMDPWHTIGAGGTPISAAAIRQSPSARTRSGRSRFAAPQSGARPTAPSSPCPPGIGLRPPSSSPTSPPPA